MCLCVHTIRKQIYIGFICIANKWPYLWLFIKNVIETFIAFCCGKSILHVPFTHTHTHLHIYTNGAEGSGDDDGSNGRACMYVYGIFARFHFDYFWHYLFDALKVVTLGMLIFTANSNPNTVNASCKMATLYKLIESVWQFFFVCCLLALRLVECKNCIVWQCS